MQLPMVAEPELQFSAEHKLIFAGEMSGISHDRVFKEKQGYNCQYWICILKISLMFMTNSANGL